VLEFWVLLLLVGLAAASLAYVAGLRRLP